MGTRGTVGLGEGPCADDTVSEMGGKRTIRHFVLVLAVGLLTTSVLGNSLSVTPNAAMRGTDFGLQVNLNGKRNLVYVAHFAGRQDTLTTEVFLNLTKAKLSNKRLLILAGYAFSPFRPVFELEARRKPVNGKPMVKFYCRTNDGEKVLVGKRTVNFRARIEVDFVAASGPNAGDGICRLRVGGNPRGAKNSLKNGKARISSVRMGALRSGAWSALSGPVYFDEYVSKR